MPNLFHVHGSHLRQRLMDCERDAKVRDDRSWKRRGTTIYVVLVVMLVAGAVELALAGGPQYVAGISFGGDDAESRPEHGPGADAGAWESPGGALEREASEREYLAEFRCECSQRSAQPGRRNQRLHVDGNVAIGGS